MSFTDQFRILFTRKGLFATGTTIHGGFLWIFHFVLAFSVLSEAELEPILILFSQVAVPAGSTFFLVWSSKHNQILNYLVSTLVLGLSLVALVLFRDPFLVVVFLVTTGFSIGNIFPMLYDFNSFLFSQPEYNGRQNSFGIFSTMLILIPGVIIISTGIEALQILFLVGLLTIFLLIFFISKNSVILPPRRNPLRFYFRKKVFPSTVLLLCFFVGFFYTNAYYAVILMLKTSEKISQSYIYPESLYFFVFVLSLTILIASVPSGILSDKIGRRWSLLIGFYLVAIGFFIIPILRSIMPGISEETLLLLIFPIITGVGLTFALWGGYFLAIFELAPKGYLTTHSGIAWVFLGLGWISGIITTDVLKAFLIDQPFLLPIVMIFAYFTATIVVIHQEEPLPPKAELEWRRKTEHILVLSKSGLPLFSQPLQKKELEADVALAGGAIIGISSIINEITQVSGVRVIKQPNYCIMMEEGSQIILAVMVTEELKTVRNKMLDFVVDFESFFEELLQDWRGELKVFSPTKRLVEKHFG